MEMWKKIKIILTIIGIGIAIVALLIIVISSMGKSRTILNLLKIKKDDLDKLLKELHIKKNQLDKDDIVINEDIKTMEEKAKEKEKELKDLKNKHPKEMSDEEILEEFKKKRNELFNK